MSRDQGNLTWARRRWGQRTRRAVARNQDRGGLCGKKDKPGLMEGKCTSCYLVVAARIAGPAASPG